jgi:hypothetical protein
MLTMIKDNEPSSLERYVALPSLLQASSCSMWLAYALCVLNSPALLTNNIIGVTVSLFYVAVFVAKRPTTQGKVLVAVSWMAAIGFTCIIYGSLFAAPATAASSPSVVIVAVLTVTITCLLWASPLAALRSAALDLDDERVPVPLTTFMFAAVALWLVAGLLLNDVPLIVSSTIGVFCTILQLFVLCKSTM